MQHSNGGLTYEEIDQLNMETFKEEMDTATKCHLFPNRDAYTCGNCTIVSACSKAAEQCRGY